jgi:hypothetical protein
MGVKLGLDKNTEWRSMRTGCLGEHLHQEGSKWQETVENIMWWVEYVARIGEMINAYKILVGKTEEERLLRSRRCKLQCRAALDCVVLCGVVVIVLAIGRKVRGFKPDREQRIFLKGLKIREPFPSEWK